MTEKDPSRKKRIKENTISVLITVVLSLGAWFGVKMLVVNSGTPANASNAKKSSATLQLGATGTRAGATGGFQGGGAAGGFQGGEGGGFPGGGPGGN